MNRAPIALFLVVLAACEHAPTTTYGFVATLGNDTTSIERVSRSRTRIVSDAIGRSPRVTRRHWEAELADDGTVKHWSQDTYVPNAAAPDQHIHYTADFSGDAVRLSRETDAGSRDWSYKNVYPATVPWNAFVYGTYELLLDAARRSPDAKRIGQYFFEGWDEAHIGYAVVGRKDDRTYSIGSTGLAGTGEARVDSAGRMLSYSGAGTTYKQEVHRVDSVPNFDAIASRFAAEEQRTGVPSQLSPRDAVHATVGAATLTIDYGRPARRGRALVGNLIPYNQVWRTGANAATQLTTTAPIDLGGASLPAGSYTLWTMPTPRNVQLIINGQTGQWGTEYDASRDVARVPMTVDSVAPNTELFTISIDPDTARGARTGARLVMTWGEFRWSVPVRTRP